MTQYSGGDSDRTAKMRRTASFIALRNWRNMINRRPMDFNTMRKIMENYFVEKDVIHSWNVVIEKGRTIGEQFIPERMIDKFLSDCTEQFSVKTNTELDTLTNAFLMGSSTDGGISINLRFPDCLVSNFKLAGTYGCIYGLPRSGKTSLACYFMSIFDKVQHMDVITNIPIDNKPDWIHLEKKLSGIIRQMVLIKKWICILDETATYIPKQRAMSETNIDFINLCRFVGKLGGRLILITHDFDRDIPTILQTFISERYEKVDLDKMTVTLGRQGGYIKMYETIRDIPDAELKFITEDITSVDFDISVAQLLQDVQEATSHKDMLIALDKQLERKEPHADTSDAVDEMMQLIADGTKTTEALRTVSKQRGIKPTTLKNAYYMQK